MILAGGRVGELSVLTLKRPKSAVPFGGIYRIIDFALSNLMHFGIDNVGVLSQYRSSSLIDHVGVGGPWNMSGRRRGVQILPPYQGVKDYDWYRGTADAIYQNINYIHRYRPDNVLILSGDHIYQMDYYPLFKLHYEKKADLTMAFKPVPWEGASRFGIAEIDSDGRVHRYEEKPERPRSNLASLTIYLFRTDVLLDRLEENAAEGMTYQLYDEVIPKMVSENRVYAHIFEGYWAYSRTVDTYYGANMDCLSDTPMIDLDGWRVRTNLDIRRPGDLPPARFEAGAVVRNSIVSGGCVVEGEVRRSVLSPFVRVGKGACVVDSVVMHDSLVEEGAVVDRAVIDKQVVVSRGARVGAGTVEGPNRESPTSICSGVTVIGKDVRLPEGIVIGRNCVVCPDLVPGDFPSGPVACGETIGK
jgi:glucose-1-phosphate adenylyltransferase